MTMKILTGILSGLLLIAVSSCSYSSGKKDAEKEPGTEPANKIHRVEISRMEFHPASIQVKKGDKVVFVNLDLVTHKITEEKPAGWSSPVLQTEESWSIDAAEPVNYYCSLHPVMKGRIIVE